MHPPYLPMGKVIFTLPTLQSFHEDSVNVVHWNDTKCYEYGEKVPFCPTTDVGVEM